MIHRSFVNIKGQDN